MKKLVYIARTNMPSRAANSMQTMKMALALNSIENNFMMISGKPLISVKGYAKLRSFYNVPKTFNIKLINDSIFGISRLRSRVYLLRMRMYLKKHRSSYVYTRLEEIAIICNNYNIDYILETHAIPKQLSINPRILNSKNLIALITISSFLEIEYQKYIPKEKIHVLHDGVEVESYDIHCSKEELRAKCSIGEEGIVVIYSGHLYKHRGIENILQVSTMHKDCQFILVGGWSSDIRRIRKLVEKEHLSNVDVRGFVEPRELPLYLCSADIALMQYSEKINTAKWMSPLKVFEYMAAGLSIVASDLGAISAILKNDKTAILVKPDSTKELSDAITKLKENSAFRNELSKNARELALKYDWKTRASYVQGILRR